MADAENSTDVQTTNADANVSTQSKTWEDTEVKKIISERQELKAKLKAIDDERIKQEEAKAKEQGKYQELLQNKEKEFEVLNSRLKEAEIKAKQFEETQIKIREEALKKITDIEIKKIAEKFSDVNDVIEFVNTIEKKRIETFNNKPTTTNPEMKFKSQSEFEAHLREIGKL